MQRLNPLSVPLVDWLLQLATMAGPLAGEEMHGLCFLLERVDVAEDCLAGSPSAAVSLPPNPSSPEGDATTSTGDGNPGDGSRVPPLLPSSASQHDVERVGGEGGDLLEGSEVAEVDDGDSSVGRGSAKSSAAASNRGGQREPHQVRDLLCVLSRMALCVW